MLDHGVRAVVRRIIEGMWADPATLNGVVDAARAESPPVAALPREDVRQRIAPLLAGVAAAFIDGAELDVGPADQLASDRAVQGIALDALLDGFQAGRRYLLARFVDLAQVHQMSPGQAFEALVELDKHGSKLLNRLIHTYREAELAMTRTADATRIEALRRLLHDGPGRGLVATGLNASQRYHCIVTGISDPATARGTAVCINASGGISGMVDGYLCGVTPALPPSGQFTGHLAVASPKARPEALPRAYKHCAQARDAAARRARTGLHALTDLTALVLLDGQADLAGLLATDLLAALDPASPLHLELARTALAYLDHGGRADLTAADLHLHPNTVKHRLRRLADLTGLSLPDRSDQAVDRLLPWWCALQSWLQSAAAPPAGPGGHRL